MEGACIGRPWPSLCAPCEMRAWKMLAEERQLQKQAGMEVLSPSTIDEFVAAAAGLVMGCSWANPAIRQDALVACIQLSLWAGVYYPSTVGKCTTATKYRRLSSDFGQLCPGPRSSCSRLLTCENTAPLRSPSNPEPSQRRCIGKAVLLEKYLRH